MHNYVLCALYRLECLLDYVLAGLGENLDCDIVGNEVVLDKPAEEGIFCLRGGGEADFNLFEADFDEQFEKLYLCVERHGLDKALVAVAQVYRAPHGRTLNHALLRPVHTAFGGEDKLGSILVEIFHITLF